MDIVSYILAKKYTDNSIQGISGVLAGKNCTIKSTSKTDGVTTIVFEWTADSGDTRTTSIEIKDGETPQMSVTPISGGNRVEFTTSDGTIAFNVMDGISPSCVVTTIEGGHKVKFTTATDEVVFNVLDGTDGEDGEDGSYVATASVNSSNHLIITLSDSRTIDAGEITTLKGEDGKSAYEIAVEHGYVGTEEQWLNDLKGFSPEITVEQSTEDIYKLRITTEDGSYVTPNLKGSGGGVSSLGALTDVNILHETDGQVLKYNGSTNKWENADDGGNIESLGDISDVRLTDTKNGQLIRYNYLSREWENSDVDTIPTENSRNLIESRGVYNSENEIKTQIGTLSNLETNNKTKIVGAVNEVNSNVNSLSYPRQFSTMPLASEYPQKVVQYVGNTSGDYVTGYFYRSTPSIESGEIVYSWVQSPTQPSNTDYENLDNIPSVNNVELVGNKSLNDLGIQGRIQYAVLPTPNNALVGKVLQYTGETTSNYTTNYFYQCVWDTDSSTYVWKNVDVSSNTALKNRVSTLETNQGDMTKLEVSGARDIVTALNILSVKGIKSITYSEPYLTITLQDDSSYNFDITVILNATEIGELANVLDNNIANGDLLQYDTSISKYKPYNIVSTLTTLLQDAKDYTDIEIQKAVVSDAVVCDAKPTYDDTTGVVVYYQGGTMHTTTKSDTRFYYTVNNDSFCTSWIEGIEFTFSVATIDFSEYVDKNTDVISTYNTSIVDKDKIPDIASMDALYALLANAIGLKVNTADIVDNLNSDNATVPLSAKQGKTLKGMVNEKQPQLQLATMPVCDSTYVDKIYQYIGATGGAYINGRFYKGTYDSSTDTYSWKEVPFSSTYDATVIQGSTNAPQGGAVYSELQLRQPKQLETPIVVDSTQQTTVEGALGAINNKTVTVDTAITQGSTNPVTNGAIYNALLTKQNKTLATPITIGSASFTTVEDILRAIANAINGACFITTEN